MKVSFRKGRKLERSPARFDLLAHAVANQVTCQIDGRNVKDLFGVGV